MATSWVDDIAIPYYENLYKELHQNPGLSLQEVYASEVAAKNLELLNGRLPPESRMSIHQKIGGHGLVGVLKNGSGPTVLLRADMDALPVQEKTGLPYASTRREVDSDGIEKPVMHACGHDMHVTCLLAAVEAFIRRMSEWAGTLIFLFQPNEERGGGAQAMVDDDLYKTVPVPDVVLGQHVMPNRTGRVMVRTGTQMAAADSFRITLFGRGGHGSMPHFTIDPVVLGANVVTRLHQIVAREIDPNEPAVLTVGSLQAGQTENIIADRATLLVNIRSQSPRTRKKVLAAVERICKGESQSSGSPKEPLIEETSSFPMTINDARLTKKITETFSRTFGEQFQADEPAVNASEDVSVLATAIGKPCCFWFFGGVDADTYDKAEREGKITDIAVNHSPNFAPCVQPTLRTGLEALCSAALTFLAKEPL